MAGMERRTFLKYAGVAVVAAGATIAGLLSLGLGGQTLIPRARAGELTIYSGRGEFLIAPLLERLEKDSGLTFRTRYGDTAELAATILEEGQNSPADLFFAQDAGALGALAREGRLLQIPEDLMAKVGPSFRSTQGDWIGITGRARTVDYNTRLVNESDLPDSIWGFTDPKWGNGKIGWAPTNGSFQAFITAFRVLEGDERTREWLEGVIANDPQEYPKNSPIVEALGRGEIQIGFVNNYYLHRFQAVDPAFPVSHHYTSGDAGSMINVAGIGILDTARDPNLAASFIELLLEDDSQRYFANETFEYPLIDGIRISGPQKPLAEIEVPDIDLSDLDDLEGTLKLLRDVGVL